MKNKVLKLLLLLVTIKSFGQDSIVEKKCHSQIFSLSPISKKVDKVNGLVFGVGHVDNKNILNQTINGINIEANPAPAVGSLLVFMIVMHLPEICKNNKKNIPNDSTKVMETNLKIENWTKKPNLKINGLNISTGCFFTTTSMNGINLSLGNKFVNFNGLSIAPLGTISDKQNGVSIGLINASNLLNGASIGLYNQSYKLNGLQFGVYNQVKTNSGLQIGIFNKSNSKGFQIGFWNKNNSRSFPILNC